MDDQQTVSSAIKIIKAPSLQHIQVAAQWLADYHPENPDLEVALNFVLNNQITPHERGGIIAIAAHSCRNNSFTEHQVQGIVLLKPGNTNLCLESHDQETANSLFAMVQSQGCPQRIVTSGQVKHWIHPVLVRRYRLQREYDQKVMICIHPPGGGAGRWAQPQDKPALQNYAQAYLAERGSGSLHQNWDNLIEQKRVAVLEDHGKIVSVVKWTSTIRHGIVLGTFTFPQFRQQGYARRLLAFLTQALLKEYPAVKLWVDEENHAAIALYRSVGFQPLGFCYTGYFKD